MGTLAGIGSDNGGEIVGVRPTDGYTFEASKAVFQEDWFVGPALDEDNQSDLTMTRIRAWLEQVAEEAKIEMTNKRLSR